MITDLNVIGTPVVIVDVEEGEQFVFRDANDLAGVYYRSQRNSMIGRNAEDHRGLSEMQARGLKRSVSLYRRCLKLGESITTTTKSSFDDGSEKWARHTLVPVFSGDVIRQIIVTTVEISDLKKYRQDLLVAMTKVLSGYVTICSWCKEIKNDEEGWQSLETYAADHLDYNQFSHGICPNCEKKHFDAS